MILTVHYDGEEAVEQRLEALVSTCDDFMEDLQMKHKEDLTLSLSKFRRLVSARVLSPR